LSLFHELKRRNVFKVSVAYIVMAWLVMQVADVVINNISAPPWVFHVLLLFLAIGLPFAVFFAWAYELTPEGLKREHEVDRTQSIAPKTSKKLNIMILAVMLLALGYFAYDKFVLDASREAALIESTTQAVTEQAAVAEKSASFGTEKSIAVLPFVDMSPEKDQEYMSDGIAEELLNLLARIPELKVTSRSSAFSFKGEKINIPDVAKKLKVAYILEGSVRKAGEQLRITAQLIDTSTDTHLWSATYDRSLDNIFAIQDEISNEVIKALRIQLLGDAPSTASTDTEAYTLYLKGKHFEALDGMESWELSESAYKAALAIDPNYAPAWAGLSFTLNNRAIFGYIDVHEGTEASRQAAIRALELDDTLADAWAALAAIQFTYDWDWDRAAGTIRTALQYGPRNMVALETATAIYRGLGRSEQAIDIARKAVELDPISLSSLRNLAVTYWLAGKFSESEKMFYQIMELYPELETIRAFLAVQLQLQEKPEEAMRFIDPDSENVWQRFASAMVLYSLGRDEDSMRVLGGLIEEYNEALAFQIAEIHAVRGSPDEAFEWLELAYQQKDAGFIQILLDPFLVSLHDDPRWELLLENVGVLNYWKELQAKSRPE
jgi:TolB-like protein